MSALRRSLMMILMMMMTSLMSGKMMERYTSSKDAKEWFRLVLSCYRDVNNLEAAVTK
jgi:hypothetical protein